MNAPRGTDSAALTAIPASAMDFSPSQAVSARPSGGETGGQPASQEPEPPRRSHQAYRLVVSCNRNGPTPRPTRLDRPRRYSMDMTDLHPVLGVRGVILLLVAWHSRASRRERRQERLHKETMAAMEKGIPLPGLPAGRGTRPASAALGARRLDPHQPALAARHRRRVRRCSGSASRRRWRFRMRRSGPWA